MERNRENVWREFAEGQGEKLREWTKMLEEHLLSAARDEGGSLNLEQLHLVLRGWRQDRETYEDKIIDILRSYELWVTDRPWVEDRQNLAARLVVDGFQTLLDGYHPDGIRGGALSRKFVPPFLKAVRMLVGSEIFAETQAELEAVLKSVQRSGRDPRDSHVWVSVYSSHQGVVAWRRITGRFLARFDPLEKRVDWLVHYINHNFPAWSAEGADADWKCTERHVYTLLFTLSESLGEMMKDAAGVQELKRVLARDDYRALRKVLGELSQRKP